MPIGARNSSFRGRNLQGAACGLGGSREAKQSDPGETDSPTRVKLAVRPGSNSQFDPGQTENPPWQAVSALSGRGWFSPAEGEALPFLPAEAPHFAVASAENTAASPETPEFLENPASPGKPEFLENPESPKKTPPIACPLSENYVLVHPK